MRASRQFAAALICIGISSFCLAGRPPMHFYRTGQGLPRNSVRCMVAGQNGVMWFCTTEGLARFDGQEFRVFGAEQGLPSRAVFSFAPARGGGYWVITDRGVCRLAAGAKIGDTCRSFASDTPAVWAGALLAQSSTGEVWVASEERVFRVRPETSTLEDISFPLKPEESILALAASEPGKVFLGTEKGLFEGRRGGKARSLTSGLPSMGTSFILRHPSGDYWLATASGLCRMRLKGADRKPEFKAFPLSIGLPNYLLLARDGTLWASVGIGVVQMEIDGAGEAHLLRRIDQTDGLPAPVQSLAEDSGGHVWVSVAADGVVRIDDNGFTAYGEAEGLGSARIASIFKDRTGRICITTSWNGSASVRLLRDGRFLDLPVPAPKVVRYFGQGWNQFGLQAHDGEWWIPTGEGLLRFGAVPAEDLPKAPLKNWYRHGAGLACTEIYRVFEDSTGDIWVSCDGPAGVLRWSRRADRFQHLGAANGWPPDQHQFATTFRESAGAMWMSVDGGLVRFRDDRFQFVRMGEKNLPLPPRDLFVDSARRLWVATQGDGLFRCDQPDEPQPRFVNYRKSDGLASSYVRAITEDHAGLIYVSSVRGVDRIDPRGPVDAGHIRHFTAADGLPDNEHNVAFAAPNGHLWFGTLRGLAEYDPSRAPAPEAPDAYFTRLRVRGEEVPLAWEGARQAALALSPDRNQIQIEFFASGESPAALRFQYRLIGAGEEWSEPAGETSVNYPALPSGHLRFEVRAINADGRTSTIPAALDLDVAAPIWRRGWFLLLLTVAGGGVAAMAYRYRVDQLLALERLRTRIATDLHDDIGASLSQIAIWSEVARNDASPGSLEVISRIARETVEQMSDIVWAVNPRHDRFDAMLHRMRRFAGDTLGGAGIELEFHADKLPADLTTPIEARRPLYLMFKEAINNAARHSGAKLVAVDIEVTRGVLRMTIADDGRGFDAHAAHEGEGVASIERRMRDLGGTVDWKTAPGQGTLLILTLPHKLMGRGKVFGTYNRS